MEDKKQKQEQQGGKVGTVVGIILCVLLVPILIVNVTMIIKGYVNKDKVPTFLGYAPMIVLTDSMYPTIQSGDLVIVKSLDAADVREGDIISFFDPDGNGTSVVTHRVVTVHQDAELSFTTKGDGNNTEDISPVPAANLVGRYQTRIKGAGNVAMFLQTTPGLIVCVALPLILLVLYEMLRRRKYDKAKDADTQALLAELEALRAKQNAGDAGDKPAETDTAE